MLAYPIAARSLAAEPTPSTWPTSLLAGRAGNASTTASASTYSGEITGPTVSRQPSVVLASSLTVALVRTSAPLARASASGNVPSPAASVANTGGGVAPWSAGT